TQQPTARRGLQYGQGPVSQVGRGTHDRRRALGGGEVDTTVHEPPSSGRPCVDGAGRDATGIGRERARPADRREGVDLRSHDGNDPRGKSEGRSDPPAGRGEFRPRSLEGGARGRRFLSRQVGTCGGQRRARVQTMAEDAVADRGERQPDRSHDDCERQLYPGRTTTDEAATGPTARSKSTSFAYAPAYA